MEFAMAIISRHCPILVLFKQLYSLALCEDWSHGSASFFAAGKEYGGTAVKYCYSTSKGGPLVSG